MSITPLPAFSDNYFWLLSRAGHAVVVDPGDAAPVLLALRDRQLRLDAILVTHHHGDHVGGVEKLRADTGARVFGPRRERIAGVDVDLAEGDSVTVLDTDFIVIEVPGHTSGHIAYFTASLAPPALFCGDTLFGCGCGRLFEGTPAQMLASLDRLAALPANTRVYCAHEYTLANIRFALVVDPANPELQRRQHDAAALRDFGEPTLPSTIGLELRTNPFMRSDSDAVRAAAVAHAGAPAGRSRTDVFTAIRAWKNEFR
ncbi:MAG TPA: hydroxyacylglutathione hydrolase [Burkholderiaceae bacterium]|nr:hydroxyacylglutathione hydrolase [Burkholderiaceae bacterium]